MECSTVGFDLVFVHVLHQVTVHVASNENSTIEHVWTHIHRQLNTYEHTSIDNCTHMNTHPSTIEHAWTDNLTIYLFIFFNTIFVSSHMYPETRRYPSNRRLNEHGIYIRHCQESNSQPVPSQAGADTTRPQWRTIEHVWTSIDKWTRVNTHPSTNEHVWTNNTSIDKWTRVNIHPSTNEYVWTHIHRQMNTYEHISIDNWTRVNTQYIHWQLNTCEHTSIDNWTRVNTCEHTSIDNWTCVNAHPLTTKQQQCFVYQTVIGFIL